MSRYKAYFLNLFLLILATAIALSLGEAVVRAVMPQQLYRYPSGMFVSHPTLQYRLAAGFEGVTSTTEYGAIVRTNESGLRAEREYGPKMAGTYRVLVLGDSFIMGVGVEADQTFASVLEDRLNQYHKDEASYEVINAGVPGYNTAQEVMFLEQIGIELDPDLVILAFFLGNDVQENADPVPVSVVNGTLISGDSEDGLLPLPLRYWLQRHSHLFSAIRTFWHSVSDPNFGESMTRLELREFSIYSANPDTEVERAWRVSEDRLEEFAQVAERLGVKAAVLLISERRQVVEEIWHSIVERLGLAEKAYERDYPNRRLLAFLGNVGVPALDLFDTFTTSEPDTDDYFGLDNHWTVKGNRIAAERVRELLLEQGVLP